MAEAMVLIEERRVHVDDLLVVSAAHQVHKNNQVTLNGQVLIARPSRYLLLNKPIDMICSTVDDKYPTALSLLKVDRLSELHIAGRLDVDTTGLILITDDGHWSFNLTSPQSGCEKVYKVSLSKPISLDAVQQFHKGVLLHGESKLTLPAKLEIINPHNVLLTITEGRYHQVKRMFFAIGNKVTSLHRQKIGSLELDIDIGEWRNLTTAEVKALSY